eukprot:646067-Pyramimonas_sp.AAC.1
MLGTENTAMTRMVQVAGEEGNAFEALAVLPFDLGGSRWAPRAFAFVFQNKRTGKWYETRKPP